GMLAFVFAMAARFGDTTEVWNHLLLFSGGALAYAGYALAMAYIFDDRVRRLLLAEAMRAFVVYLRAKAALYDSARDTDAAFRTLIDAHAALVERLQDARNALYARRQSPRQLRRIDTLIALLDSFEIVLSSDADIETLQRSAHHHLMRRLSALTSAIADEVEELTLALRAAKAQTRKRDHAPLRAAIAAEVERLDAAGKDDAEAQIVAAFRSTADKLSHADMHVARLAAALDKDTPPSTIAQELDLAAFRQRTPLIWDHLTRQFSLGSPALRYAIRLSLAMAAGLLLTQALPGLVHGNWVLLTIALIMRANYSVTRQRRWDRITGTLQGCVLAVIFVDTLPQGVLLAAIVLGIGVSHAYGAVQYRVTAVSASITALLLLHFETPIASHLVFTRITDTLIGAGLSYVFSFLLPSWERKDLPRIVRALLAADAAYAREALAREFVRHNYRLARKRALDMVGALAGAARRLADEPGANRNELAALGKLLGANYLLASDLSSMPILMRLRGKELEPVESDALIGAARETVIALLSPAAADIDEDKTHLPREGFSGLELHTGIGVLTRRLVHIEHAARKVARLAAQL
ncbi:MAG TPA: FUSC family membrane protein, partial [Rhizomicrobium sp.]